MKIGVFIMVINRRKSIANSQKHHENCWQKLIAVQLMKSLIRASIPIHQMDMAILSKNMFYWALCKHHCIEKKKISTLSALNALQGIGLVHRNAKNRRFYSLHLDFQQSIIALCTKNGLRMNKRTTADVVAVEFLSNSHAIINYIVSYIVLFCVVVVLECSLPFSRPGHG